MTENVSLHDVADRVQIVEQDIFTVDLSKADVAMMYLLPWMMNRLLPQFEQMKPGCRIVSHEFWIDGIVPDEIVEIPDVDGQTEAIYLYKTPLLKNPLMEPGRPPVPADLPGIAGAVIGKGPALVILRAGRQPVLPPPCQMRLICARL